MENPQQYAQQSTDKTWVQVTTEDFARMKMAQKTLDERNTQIQELSNTIASLQNKLNILQTNFDDAASKLAEAYRAKTQVGTLDGILNQFLEQALLNTIKSQQFENRINEELEKAVDKFRETEEFSKQIDSAVTDYLENTTIEVDEHVEKAIQQALDSVSIRFHGH